MFFGWELQAEVYIEDGSSSGGGDVYLSAPYRNKHNL